MIQWIRAPLTYLLGFKTSITRTKKNAEVRVHSPVKKGLSGAHAIMDVSGHVIGCSAWSRVNGK